VSNQDFPSLYAREIAREANHLWREHRKQELIITSVTAPISAVVVAATIAIIAGAGFSWSAILAGLAAAIVSIPIVLVFLYAYYRLYEAPRSLYQKTREQSGVIQARLAEEQAKNARPEFAGRMIDIADEWIMNTWQDRWFFKEGVRDHAYDCFITLHLSITNNSVQAGPVSGFELQASFKGEQYTGTETSVEGYFVRRRTVRPAWGGDPINKYRYKWKPLEPFPLNEEITNTNYKAGWIRFYLGTFAPENKALAGDPRNLLELRLTALDHRREPHTVLEGPITMPGQGERPMIADAAGVERDREENRPSVE
jgi:phosphoribosylcarboxyaminoimidazole (NCAIR) mutase